MRRYAVSLVMGSLILLIMGIIFIFQIDSATDLQNRSRLNQAYIRDAACIVSRAESESRRAAVDRCEKQIESELHVDITNYSDSN